MVGIIEIALRNRDLRVGAGLDGGWRLDPPCEPEPFLGPPDHILSSRVLFQSLSEKLPERGGLFFELPPVIDASQTPPFRRAPRRRGPRGGGRSPARLRGRDGARRRRRAASQPPVPQPLRRHHGGLHRPGRGG